MTRYFGVGLGGLGLLWLAACGGTVDLQQAQGGSAGSAPTAGAAVGGYAGTLGNHAGSSNPGDGGSAAFPGPATGALAYDADRDGNGRAIYLRWFGDDCTQRLTEPTLQAKQPAFSPDGSMLAYAGWVTGRFQIHVTTLATGETKIVTGHPAGATSPTFSPDSKQLAYVTGDPELFANREPAAGDLVLLDLASGDTATLIDADMLGCCVAQSLSPTFVSNSEIMVGTRAAILAVDVHTGATRDVVPLTGRIPNPQDPTVAPDGLRYAFSDFCGVGLSLFIARVDGSTGDTCQSARAVGGGNVVSADWGKSGYIAAQISDAPGGILLVQDSSLRVAPLVDTEGAKNPSWAPEHLAIEPSCK
jgi:dipeptidyl aminopeptidase/acylaminoacyl peptidase